MPMKYEPGPPWITAQQAAVVAVVTPVVAWSRPGQTPLPTAAWRANRSKGPGMGQSHRWWLSSRKQVIKDIQGVVKDLSQAYAARLCCYFLLLVCHNLHQYQYICDELIIAYTLGNKAQNGVSCFTSYNTQNWLAVKYHNYALSMHNELVFGLLQ